MNSILLRDICLAFSAGTEEKTIFKNFTYRFTKPGIYAITGPSGSGKSTLLKLISGKLAPGKGQILYDGIDRNLSFNNNSLFYEPLYSRTDLSVREVYTLSLYDEKSTPRESKLKADEILKNPLLQPIMHRKIKSLSTGEKRLIEYYSHKLIRADFYLFDEPFAGISDENLPIVEDDILELAKESCVILTLHPRDSQYGFINSCREVILP